MIRDPGDFGFGMATPLRTATFDELSEGAVGDRRQPRDGPRQAIVAFAKEFRIGNLLVQLQMGGMPHDLTMRNISLFADGCCRGCAMWADEEWAHEWWPTGRRTWGSSTNVATAGRDDE